MSNNIDKERLSFEWRLFLYLSFTQEKYEDEA
jgi:hypothetical protein